MSRGVWREDREPGLSSREPAMELAARPELDAVRLAPLERQRRDSEVPRRCDQQAQSFSVQLQMRGECT